MRIIDNFLKNEEINFVLKNANTDKLCWESCQKVVGDDSKYNHQHVHTIYDFLIPCSPLFGTFHSGLGKLKVLGLFRIKMNKEFLYSKRYYSKFHYDCCTSKGTPENPVGHDYMRTGILYLNTCDGYTEFEDGKIVESVANRFIEFPTNTKHRGVSQLDTDFRFVVNFNYFIE